MHRAIDVHLNMPESKIKANSVRVPVDAAVRKAVDYIKSLGSITAAAFNHMMVGEVEYRGGVWLTTLGYDGPSPYLPVGLGGQPQARVQKTTGIDGKTSDPLWMKSA